jgi:hypothetical protein
LIDIAPSIKIPLVLPLGSLLPFFQKLDKAVLFFAVSAFAPNECPAFEFPFDEISYP